MPALKTSCDGGFGDESRICSNSSRQRNWNRRSGVGCCCCVLQVQHAPDTARSTSTRLPQQPERRIASRRVQCRSRSDSRPSDGLPDLTCLCAGGLRTRRRAEESRRPARARIRRRSSRQARAGTPTFPVPRSLPDQSLRESMRFSGDSPN